MEWREYIGSSLLNTHSIFKLAEIRFCHQPDLLPSISVLAWILELHQLVIGFLLSPFFFLSAGFVGLGFIFIF